MPLLYKPVQNTVKSEDGNKKWRPALVKFNHTITTEQISEDLAELSSLSVGDTYNVIRNLPAVLKRYLLNSYSVNLEGLGTYTAIAKTRGNGVDKPEDVSPGQINSLRIQFTPTATRTPDGGLTRSIFTGVKYELYGSQSGMTHIEGDNPGGNDDDDDGYQDPGA